MKSFRSLAGIAALLAVMMATGCASSEKPIPYSGFISDYSALKRVDNRTARYVSPRLADYDTFVVDPIELRGLRARTGLTHAEQAEIAEYFDTSFKKVLRRNNYRLADRSAKGVARLRLAITEVKKPKVLLNLHPLSKAAGVGVGGASMEGEIVDSISHEQLAAVVRSGTGNQFELDTFDNLDDVKDVIDRWAAEAEKRLRELRAARNR